MWTNRHKAHRARFQKAQPEFHGQPGKMRGAARVARADHGMKARRAARVVRVWKAIRAVRVLKVMRAA